MHKLKLLKQGLKNCSKKTLDIQNNIINGYG